MSPLRLPLVSVPETEEQTSPLHLPLVSVPDTEQTSALSKNQETNAVSIS